MSPLCCGRPRLKILAVQKATSLGDPLTADPQKTEKSQTFLGQHKGQNGFTSKASNLSQETCISKIHLMKVYGVSLVFVGGVLGGKMLKCFKVFLERKRGPTTNGCYKNPLLGPLHLGHPQTANCQFRKLDIRQFLVCPQMGHVVFFAKISENAWHFLNFANNAIQDNPFQILQTPEGLRCEACQSDQWGKKKRPLRAGPASLRLCLKPSAPQQQKVRFKFFGFCVSY